MQSIDKANIRKGFMKKIVVSIIILGCLVFYMLGEYNHPKTFAEISHDSISEASVIQVMTEGDHLDHFKTVDIDDNEIISKVVGYLTSFHYQRGMIPYDFTKWSEVSILLEISTENVFETIVLLPSADGKKVKVNDEVYRITDETFDFNEILKMCNHK